MTANLLELGELLTYHIKNTIGSINKIENIKKLLLNYNSLDYKLLIENIIVSDCNCNKYHKLLVLKNEYVEIYLIIWFDGAETPIHDHPEDGCVVKILEGTLTEEVFENTNNLVQLIQINKLNKLDINCKAGNKILHRIKSSNYSVSIHVYFPPSHIQSIFYLK